jgi:hypothetical protein
MNSRLWNYLNHTAGIPKFRPFPDEPVARVPVIGEILTTEHTTFQEGSWRFSLEPCDGSSIDAITHPQLFLHYSSGGDLEVTIPAANVASDLTGYLGVIRLNDMPADFWTLVDGDETKIALEVASSPIPYFIWDFDSDTQTGYIYFLMDLSSTVDNVITVIFGGATVSTADIAATLTNYHQFAIPQESNSTFWELVKPVKWQGFDNSIEKWFNSSYSANENQEDANVSTNFGWGVNASMPVIYSTGGTDGDSFTFGFTSSHSTLVDQWLLKRESTYTAVVSDAVGIRIDGGFLSTRLVQGAGVTTEDHVTTEAYLFNQTKRIHVTYQNGTLIEYYADGSLVDSYVPTLSITQETVISYKDGKLNGGEDEMQGAIFCAYTHKNVLTADYIATEHHNFSDTSTFYSVGTSSSTAFRPVATDSDPVFYKVVADYQGG